MANTHYAVVTFSGDPCNEHPDPDLRGRSPFLEFIAAGDEAFCWRAVGSWVAKHPLSAWQTVEVLTRNPDVVTDEQTTAQAYRDTLRADHQ